MISPEQLINELQKENARLQEELTQAQNDIQDFEKLAIEWKKGHSQLERKYIIKLGNAEQTISQLEMELEEFKWLIQKKM